MSTLEIKDKLVCLSKHFPKKLMTTFCNSLHFYTYYLQLSRNIFTIKTSFKKPLLFLDISLWVNSSDLNIDELIMHLTNVMKEMDTTIYQEKYGCDGIIVKLIYSRILTTLHLVIGSVWCYSVVCILLWLCIVLIVLRLFVLHSCHIMFKWLFCIAM